MSFSIRVDAASWQEYIAVPRRGKALLLDPLTNKGTGFPARERDELELWGLLPPAISTMEQQLQRTYESFRAKSSNIEKYIYLAGLHDRNETLFFRLLHEHIDEMMPIAYTPVVGEACEQYCHIYRRARGLYVSYDQPEAVESILANSGIQTPSVIVVTDGERILGLGDQGIGGMGISIGKLCLYTLCAGVSPYSTLPVVLDVGTDNDARLNDPLYLGLRRHRVRGEEYQAFVDRFVAAVKKVFPHVLLQWEDFLKENAIFQLERFRDELCTFNDDIQGTAAVVVAGLEAAMRALGQRLSDQRILFAGAGASTHGIAGLLVTGLCEEGLPLSDARARLWMVDSSGLVTASRAGLPAFKAEYARGDEEMTRAGADPLVPISLEKAVDLAKPTVLIGTSATAGVFTESIVRKMAQLNPRPIILPLSNPTSKSECTPEDAIRWSDGRALVATGSPFAPVSHNGRRFRVGQANNAFIFPGVGLGVTVARARRVTDGMFLAAARALAKQTTEADLREGALFPELQRIRECSHAVACATIQQAVAEGHAEETLLRNVEQRVRRAMWFPEYLPIRYEPGNR
jgi:malic enzyme